MVDLKGNAFESQTLPGSVREVARLPEEMKRVHTEASDFDVSSHNVEVLREEVSAARNQVASLLSTGDSATKWNECVRSTLRQKIIDCNHLKKREPSLKQRLNAVKTKVAGFES